MQIHRHTKIDKVIQKKLRKHNVRHTDALAECKGVELD